MSSVVEKLAAIEREVAAIQPKMEPLSERIADLDKKVAGFAQQLSGIAEESAVIKQDIELTRMSLAKIQTLIGESKTESEQLVAGQEENLQRCETMTAVFGAAFQAMSQFFETAQQMGLADQAKAVFLAHAPNSALLESKPPLDNVPPSVVGNDKAEWEKAEWSNETIPESKTPEPITPEPAVPVAEEVMFPEVSPKVPPIEEIVEPPVMGAQVENPPEPAETLPVETAFVTEPTDAVAESLAAGVLSAVLPDVASVPEIGAVLDSGDAEPPGAEHTDALASNLDVAPLGLSLPSLPEQPTTMEISEQDEQDIEDMLANMMEPVTASVT